VSALDEYNHETAGHPLGHDEDRERLINLADAAIAELLAALDYSREEGAAQQELRKQAERDLMFRTEQRDDLLRRLEQAERERDLYEATLHEVELKKKLAFAERERDEWKVAAERERATGDFDWRVLMAEAQAMRRQRDEWKSKCGAMLIKYDEGRAAIAESQAAQAHTIEVLNDCQAEMGRQQRMLDEAWTDLRKTRVERQYRSNLHTKRQWLADLRKRAEEL
jgi:hypothetical protein